MLSFVSFICVSLGIVCHISLVVAAPTIDTSCNGQLDIATILNDAIALANAAISRLGGLEKKDRLVYENIFGSVDTSTIRSNFQTTLNILNLGTEMHISCESPTVPHPGCHIGADTFAFTFRRGVFFCQKLIQSPQIAQPYNLAELPADLLAANLYDQTRGPRPIHINYIRNLPGPLLLHEMMHWASNFYGGSNLKIGDFAYGWKNVCALGSTDPVKSSFNADSYEILAVAYYFNNYDWSSGFARAVMMDIDKRKLVRNRRPTSIA